MEQHDQDEPSNRLTRTASKSFNNRWPRATAARPRLATPNASTTDLPTLSIKISTPSPPASPPTPAPSPRITTKAPDWSTADPREDCGGLSLDDDDTHSAQTNGVGYRQMRAMFQTLDHHERQRMLAEILNMCDGRLLSFVSGFVSPRLRHDPMHYLPDELCLRVLGYIDDVQTLARSAQVSRRWRELVSDDMAWKSLCERHAYRKLSNETSDPTTQLTATAHSSRLEQKFQHPYGYLSRTSQFHNPALAGLSSSAPDLTMLLSMTADPVNPISTLAARGTPSSQTQRRPKVITYRSHFKQRYQVETAWRIGGSLDTRQITPDQGVVTSLHLTPNYIIVALDNAKIHVFDPVGRHLRCLQGHVMGVWAMVPYGDTLVSGGCDRDVRVWDLQSGQAVHMLRGHTSTVRCLKMSGTNIAISGSRDTTLRIWDITNGICKHVLVGHQASVRCLDIHGDLVVSGSYDTTARIWSISEGRCLRTLQGHFSQIYAVAFDGKRVATGSLDTSVRIWDPRDGRCLAQLQGHTSLVGQLQLRNDILVTGGSDGSVRVWSLQTYSAIHRLAAHDNSVTSLQFDDNRIVSGGSDGRVKVWDLERGVLIRELGSPAEAVWRVVFEDEKAVVLASRNGKTVMEVWSFAPPTEDEFGVSSRPYSHSLAHASSSMSMPAITPYEDPAYGERPRWLGGDPEKADAALAQQQDESMSDAYDWHARNDQDDAERFEEHNV